MTDSNFVARTAPDMAHRNTLVMRPLWTVIIFLDRPGEPKDSPDNFQLVSDEGLYDSTVPRSEATRQDERTYAVRFTGVVPDGNYSLYHRLPCGYEFPVFLAVPFTALELYGEASPELVSPTIELPTATPLPDLLSGDALLLHHELDFADIPDEDAGNASDSSGLASDANPASQQNAEGEPGAAPTDAPQTEATAAPDAPAPDGSSIQ